MDKKNKVVINPILNFNFSTKMLFRCTERKYAEDLLNGKIFFNTPRNWIKCEEIDGKGRGDSLEGTFMSVHQNSNNKLINDLKKDDTLEYFTKEKYIFFRRKKIADLWCVCFFGVNDNSFEKITDKKGIVHNTFVVGEDYFSSFSNGVEKENYKSMPNEDQPVVVFINKPKIFFDKIRKFFENMGLTKEEYIISPVEYVNKYVNTLALLKFPMELLIKDDYFLKQSEVRIIINTNNVNFCNYMKKHNNVIDIGDITNIAEIYDYYFKDLILDRYGDKVFFNLPAPKEIPLENVDITRLLEHFFTAAVKYRMTYDKEEKEELKNYILKQKEYLEDRFKFILDVNLENGKCNIYNTSTEIMKKIKKLNTLSDEETVFEQQAIRYLNDNNVDDFNKLCNEYCGKLKNNLLIYFYKGEFYKKNNNYKEAIKNYLLCLNSNFKKGKILGKIAICYSFEKKPLEAIKYYKKQQEIIGYNHLIYINIGIEYINMGLNEKALEVLNKSIELRKTSSAYYNKYVANYRLGKFNDALNDITIACEMDKNNEHYKRELFRMNKILK